jgi:hypothetical protein
MNSHRATSEKRVTPTSGQEGRKGFLPVFLIKRERGYQLLTPLKVIPIHTAQIP